MKRKGRGGDVVKRHGDTLGVLDHPIGPEALKQAPTGFP